LIREGFGSAGKGFAIRAERESWQLPIPNVRSFGEPFFWLDLEPFCGAFYGPRRVVALDPHLLIGTRGSEVWPSKICWGNCHNAILFQLVLVVRYDGLEIYLAFIGRQSEWI